MIFNILSKYERKRIRREYLENWHDWFAWYPIRMNAIQVVWLETVKRKFEYMNSGIVDVVHMLKEK